MTLESQIQRKIGISATQSGWLVYKIGGIGTGGLPDLMCLKNGVAVFLEVKVPGKAPRKLQEYQIEKIQSQGFCAEPVESVAEAEKILLVAERLSASDG